MSALVGRKRWIPGMAGVLAMLTVLGGCGSTGGGADADAAVPAPPSAPDPRTALLTGRITYLPKLTLGSKAVVKVWLQDMSEPGSPVPVIIDEYVKQGPGQVPIAFRLRYDPLAIRPERRYTLLVKIYEGDRVRFINARSHPVLTAGCYDDCEVVVDLMN
jgi:uncharacterized lipoprotein YbaY